MTATFTERTPIEAGFADVFAEQLVPQLDALEKERLSRLAVARRHAGIAVAVGAAFGLLFLLFGSGSEGWGGVLAGFGVPLVLGAAAGFLLWRRQAGKWSGSAAEAVMPVVCDFLGDLSHDHAAHKGFALERMRKLGVVKSFSKSRLSDRLEGTYRDTAFEIVEAELIAEEHDADDDGSDGTSRTIFKGLLMRIAVPEPIPTRILIARDFGFGNKLGEMFGGDSGRGMPKIDTGHAAFEEHFEVYSADPDIARDVLAPGFLDSLLSIAEIEGGRHGTEGLEAGFHDESFFMALKRDDDFLEMGGLTTPVVEIEEDLHLVFEDVAHVRRIIDRLHGDRPGEV